MPGLAAGRLARRATILRKQSVDDGHGAQNTAWVPLKTVWVEAISQNGREAVLAGALQGISAWRITMRYRSDLSSDDQLDLEGSRLNIRSIEDPDGRREQTVIFADTVGVVN